jgi:GTP-binding protein HflX
LPHELIAAFRSTLEETVQADLLLHVVDAHDPERQFRIDQVNDVLEQIGASEVPQILVFNKIDLSGDQPRFAGGKTTGVWCSAVTGAGLDHLEQALIDRLLPDQAEGWLQVGPDQGRFRARLYELGEVLSDQPDERGGGWWLKVSISRRELENLCRIEGMACRLIETPVAGAAQAP